MQQPLVASFEADNLHNAFCPVFELAQVFHPQGCKVLLDPCLNTRCKILAALVFGSCRLPCSQRLISEYWETILASEYTLQHFYVFAIADSVDRAFATIGDCLAVVFGAVAFVDFESVA